VPADPHSPLAEAGDILPPETLDEPQRVGEWSTTPRPRMGRRAPAWAV